MKRDNYLVVETEAQGFAEWVPFPGQLRLQAFSHLASGANMVSYWHWHSIHNSFETYWKGLLSHDLEPNPTYNEAKTIGRDFSRLSSRLINLKKKNDVAILVSNEALTALNWFKYFTGNLNYNDYVRLMYDALYKMNVGCDFIDPSCDNIEDYSLLIVPPLYAAPDDLLIRLNKFVENGGHIVYAFRSGFSDENTKVRTVVQPGIISEACGIHYSQFVTANNITLKDNPFNVIEEKNKLSYWIELITPTTAKILASYDHPYWGEYAAITQNNYGKGTATYIGCYPSSEVIEKVMEGVVKEAGLWDLDQEVRFPVITKTGVNASNKIIHYYLNYTEQPGSFIYPYADGIELLSDTEIKSNDSVELEGWGIVIIEEK
jgi:beta-galactosidase